ncbi:phage major capsid protein [Agromyces sp. NPDC058484]|uniref:phage major capsid protein n=1 Tax=Agromyces sp. NPDC058484 TaxID=3346524 RepID=UPI0036651532
MSTLLQQRQALLDQANAVIASAKADNDRTLTDDEEQQVKGFLDGIESLDESIARSERMDAIFSKLNNMPETIDTAPGSITQGRLSLKQAAAPAFTALQEKALVAGSSITVETPILADITPSDRAPISLLDVIPVTVRGVVYRYLRQTARTNLAAAVAAGGTKPQSTYTVTSTDARLRVVAHTSEPIDKYLLEDAVNLRRFVETELLDGLQHELERLIILGNPGGANAEEFTGLNLQSGTQTATGTSLVAALRQAITKLENVSAQPSVFVVNAGDFETAQTTRNTSGAFDWGVDGTPVDAGRRQAWGVPIITSANVPANTAWALGAGAVELASDGRIAVEWSDDGLFTKNQVRARCEGRFHLDAFRPGAIVKASVVP